MFVHTCSPHQSIQPAAVQTAIVHDWMSLRTLDLLDSFSISPPHQKLSEILMLSSWQNHPSCSRLCSASHDSHQHGRSLLLIWRFSCRIHVWGWSRVKTRMDGWIDGHTHSNSLKCRYFVMSVWTLTKSLRRLLVRIITFQSHYFEWAPFSF